LKINPPNARDTDNAPEICFAQERSRGGPLDEGEPDEAGEEQERDAQEEEELDGLSVFFEGAVGLEHDIPASTGTAMEYFLQGLTQGRKAQCQSLECNG
jgi:hypothetical protein